MSRRRRLAIFAILATGTLVSMLALLEGGARLMGYAPRRHYVPDVERGWICQPHSGFQYVSSLGRIRASIDDEGFRPTVAGRDLVGATSIVCIGDSFTFCGEAPDERTWPEFMALDLARRGVPSRAVNRGMTGYSTLQSLAALRHDLDRRGGASKPRAVVFSFCINDPNENFEQDRPHLDPAEFSGGMVFVEGRTPKVLPPVPPRITWMKKIWDQRNRLAFINAVKSGGPVTDTASYAAGGRNYSENFGPKYREFLVAPAQQEGMRYALRELKRECSSHGVPLFVVPVIMPPWDAPGESQREFRGLVGWSEETLRAQVADYHASIDLIRDMVAEVGAAFVDLRGCMNDLRYREYVAAASDWHFSIAANERIGRAVAGGLRPHLAESPVRH